MQHRAAPVRRWSPHSAHSSHTHRAQKSHRALSARYKTETGIIKSCVQYFILFNWESFLFCPSLSLSLPLVHFRFSIFAIVFGSSDLGLCAADRCGCLSFVLQREKNARNILCVFVCLFDYYYFCLFFLFFSSIRFRFFPACARAHTSFVESKALDFVVAARARCRAQCRHVFHCRNFTIIICSYLLCS